MSIRHTFSVVKVVKIIANKKKIQIEKNLVNIATPIYMFTQLS